MRRFWRGVSGTVLGFVLAACGGNTADLGGKPADGGGGHDGGVVGSDGGVVGSDSGVPVGDAGANPLSGTYKGYIQSFMFPDGSDTVLMNLTFASDGTVTGTVFFGAAPALAPPTDPSVGYPPGFPQTSTGPGLLEGFDFTVLGGTYGAPRLQLRVQPVELWKKWCELQTMIYPVDNGSAGSGCGAVIGYGCLPNVATSQNGNNCSWTSCNQPTPTPIDCGKLLLCGQLTGGACTCTATSCTVPLGPGGISFDMQLASGALDGSSTGIMGTNVYTVHLTKQ